MAVPPVLADLVSAPNAPTRSGRGGRDRRSKFYELSDNLPIRSPLQDVFVRPLAVELAPIRVNAVSPGAVDTCPLVERDAG